MAKVREIKGRMKAIGNIERITKTMKMIATVRFQSALQDSMAARPYAQKITDLVADLAKHCASDDGSAVMHPLLRRAAAGGGRKLLLVLTSNRGLCGGYNAHVLRAASQHINESGGKDVDLEVVGKKGAAYFRFTGKTVAAVHTQFGDKPVYSEIEKLARQYMDKFTSGQYDSVSVAYMSFQSAARQTPQILTLLPLQDPTDGKSEADSEKTSMVADYEFSPFPQELLGELLPLSVKTQLLACFGEAVVSEHTARMVAMQNATDAAGKMGKRLTRSFNRARQAAITTELSEIIAGATALE